MNRFSVRNRAVLLLFAAGMVWAFSGSAAAETLTVGPGQAYLTINTAIGAAENGDTINVKAGIYIEDVSVNRNNLTLRSIDGAGSAEIRGALGADVITVTSDYGVTIDGFKITPGPSSNTGIYVEGGAPTSPVTITNNVLEGFSYAGFYAQWGFLTNTTFTFSNNTISDCVMGVYALGFDACVIRVNDNTLRNCVTGLNLEEFDKNTYDPGRGVDAQVSGNTVTLGSSVSGEYGIWIRDPENTTHLSDNIIEGDYVYAIYLYNVGLSGIQPGNLFVERNKLSGAQFGIYFLDLASIPVEVTVRYNTISGNVYGIYVISFTEADDPQTEVFFKDNNIEDNANYGFYNGTNELVNARGNWWGNASGPTHDENPGGTGDLVTDYVDYGDYRTSPWEEDDDDSDSSGCSSGILNPLFLLLLAPLGLLLRKGR